jgi:hypothetical protein
MEGRLMGIELPAERLFEVTDEPVLVVEVTGADRDVATQGNPALVSLRVVEVLNGDVTAGEIIHAVWDSHSDPFYAMRGGGDELARWNASPLAVPRAGETWIVTGIRNAPPPEAPPPDPNQPTQPTQPIGPGVTDGRPPAMLPARGGFVLRRIGRVPASREAVEAIRIARAPRSGK